LGQCPGFARETFGKCRVIADAGRKDFQRHQAVELFLPRLINRSHAAFADEFEDFQLRKFRGELADGGRIEGR